MQRLSLPSLPVEAFIPGSQPNCASSLSSHLSCSCPHLKPLSSSFKTYFKLCISPEVCLDNSGLLRASPSLKAHILSQWHHNDEMSEVRNHVLFSLYARQTLLTIFSPQTANITRYGPPGHTEQNNISV